MSEMNTWVMLVLSGVCEVFHLPPNWQLWCSLSDNASHRSLPLCSCGILLCLCIQVSPFYKDNSYSGLPLVEQMVKNPPAMVRPGFDPWIRKNPWKGTATTLIFLHGEFRGQRSLANYSPWGCKYYPVWHFLNIVNYACNDAISK